MGGQSLGDRQDQIIGGFHHGGALALREPRKSGKAIIVSSHYVTHQGAYKVVTWACRLGIPSLGASLRGSSPFIWRERLNRQKNVHVTTESTI